ncbi:MAG TPA: S41 family peptidase [Stellaceae bacterium]|nr:S41 family peptidase [Stellaceae bacterium]
MTSSCLRLAVAASLAFLALVGCSSAPPQTAEGDNDADFALYRTVLDRVRASYVDPVSEGKLVANSLKGMLTGLDPHSDYMSESEYQEMLDDSQGEFAGIGAELTREDGRPKIIAPIDDTPAARAGVRSGDVILRIDGKVTDGMNLKDVVDALRGEVGSKVSISIGRHNQPPFDVTLTRAVIRIASVKWKLEPGHIGYARISNFAEKTQQELLAAIDGLTREAGGRLDGFVLDLRNDPGGLLDESVRVASDFFDGGTVVSTRGRESDDDHVYHAPPGGDRLKGVPMVVLINGASASASEIVAGALQDRHRAVIVGTRSFGKGSVQTIIPLDGHGALRLTTARYYTPSGRSIQEHGIAPDVRVLLPKDEQSAEEELIHESDLRGALNNREPGESGAADSTTASARGGEADGEEAEGTIDPTLIGTSRDYQLARALAELHEIMAHPAARAQLSGNR